MKSLFISNISGIKTHIYTYIHIEAGGAAAIPEPTLLPPQPRDNNTINDRSLSPMWAIRPSPCPPTPLSAYCHQHKLCGVLYVCRFGSGMGCYWTIRCSGTFGQVSPVSRELDVVRSAAVAAGAYVDEEAVKTEETFWKTPLPSTLGGREKSRPAVRWVQGSIWWLGLRRAHLATWSSLSTHPSPPPPRSVLCIRAPSRRCERQCMGYSQVDVQATSDAGYWSDCQLQITATEYAFASIIALIWHQINVFNKFLTVFLILRLKTALRK